MKKLKKLLTVAAAGALALTMLVGCGKSAFDTKEMINIMNDTIKTVLGGSFEIENDEMKLSVEEFAQDTELNASAKIIAEKVAEGVGEDGDVEEYFNENHDDLLDLVFEDETNEEEGYYEACAISFVKSINYKSDLYNQSKTVLQMAQLLGNAQVSVADEVPTIEAAGAAGFYEAEINGETYLFAVLQGSAQLSNMPEME